MPKAKRYDIKGKVLGEVDLPEGAFGVTPKLHAVWEVVRSYLNNQRQGTSRTKTRGEVSGGGRKPWKQKGTGRARAGSIRSPIWVGGGTTFGPQPKDYHSRVPKRVRRLAMVSALSQRAQEGSVAVLDRIKLDAPKTKVIAEFLAAAGLDEGNVCVVTEKSNEEMVLSCRNLHWVEVMPQNSMNVYDIVKADVILFEESALEGLKEVYGS